MMGMEITSSPVAVEKVPNITQVIDHYCPLIEILTVCFPVMPLSHLYDTSLWKNKYIPFIFLN
jgi:hypothetical protein